MTMYMPSAKGPRHTDIITENSQFLSVLTFAKSSCDNVLQPEPLRDSGCNTLLHEGWSVIVLCFVVRNFMSILIF